MSKKKHGAIEECAIEPSEKHRWEESKIDTTPENPSVEGTRCSIVGVDAPLHAQVESSGIGEKDGFFWIREQNMGLIYPGQ
jgi:hypothetical protein